MSQASSLSSWLPSFIVLVNYCPSLSIVSNDITDWATLNSRSDFNSNNLSASICTIQNLNFNCRALLLISLFQANLFLLDFPSSSQIFLGHPGYKQKMDVFQIECYLKKSFLLCRCNFLCSYPQDLVIKCGLLHPFSLQPSG